MSHIRKIITLMFIPHDIIGAKNGVLLDSTHNKWLWGGEFARNSKKFIMKGQKSRRKHQIAVMYWNHMLE